MQVGFQAWRTSADLASFMTNKLSTPVENVITTYSNIWM
jgi:hypothetical protein